jgi:hypothetical protein
LRFAVRRPDSPEASPRSHGMPRRDVPGRIHVSMTGETAGRARETRLTLARVRVHVPANRAPLTGECGSDLLNPARRLVLQAANQKTPPGLQDASVEACFLSNVPAWALQSAFRRSGHITDLEVFDPDQLEATCDPSACLLGPVFAPVGLASAQAGDSYPYPLATVRSPISAHEFPLQAQQSSPLNRRKAWAAQQLTSGQGCGYGDAAVYTHDLAVTRFGNGIGDRCEGYMPAASAIHRHPVGPHTCRHGAGPAESHPADLGHPDFAGLSAESVYMIGPQGHDAEPFVPPSLPPRRPPGWVVRVEERGHCLGEVPKCLLLHHLGACGQPGILSPGCRELPTLLQVAGRARAPRAPVRVLLNREVPYEPGLAAVIVQQCLLGRRGEQPVPGHANIIANTTDIPEEVKRRFLPGLEAGVSTPRP